MIFDILLVQTSINTNEIVEVYTNENSKPDVINVEQLFQSNYLFRKNTIILHNIQIKDIDIAGLERLLDNSDFTYQKDYSKSIFIPIYNIFNGLTVDEILYMGNQFIENNIHQEIINHIQDIFSDIDNDLLNYLIRNKKFSFFEKNEKLKSKELLNFSKELDVYIKNNSFFKKNHTNTELKSIVNFDVFNDIVEKEPFLDIYQLEKSSFLESLSFNDENKNDIIMKKLQFLLYTYEGFIISNNIESLNQNMLYLNYPNIRSINEEEVIFPFSMLRYILLDLEKVNIKNIYFTNRKQKFKKVLKKHNNKFNNILRGIFNFKYNFDNFDIFNQNQLIGYLNVFIFDSLNNKDNTEEVNLSLLFQKYGKIATSLSDKDLIQDYNEYMKNLNLIPIN